MSLVLCPHVVSQASEKRATGEACFARQSVCSVISLHSGISEAGHSQEFSKVDVDHRLCLFGAARKSSPSARKFSLRFCSSWLAVCLPRFQNPTAGSSGGFGGLWKRDLSWRRCAVTRCSVEKRLSRFILGCLHPLVQSLIPTAGEDLRWLHAFTDDSWGIRERR